ncbi:MAG: ZIP family metal transporter, partial [Candidatus Muiribacteriota bacterium]
MIALYAILSSFLISFISAVVFIPFFLKKKINDNILLNLLSLSVGVLLGAVFLVLLPEIFHHDSDFRIAGIIIFIGFIFMFLIEKLIHWKHRCKKKIHNHAYTLAPINIIGDGLHNLTDGFVIAASYTVSIPLGI